VAGSLLASAMAYRLFLWLLPLALLVSAGLGFLSDTSGGTDGVSQDLGVSGYIRSMVADASDQAHQSRWWLLIVALGALASAGSGGFRALTALHQLAWHRPISSTGNLVTGVLGFLFFTVAAIGAALVARWTRAQSSGVLVSGAVVTVVMFGALWWVASSRLPHGDATWRALWPGALLVGVSVQALRTSSPRSTWSGSSRTRASCTAPSARRRPCSSGSTCSATPWWARPSSTPPSGSASTTRPETLLVRSDLVSGERPAGRRPPPRRCR
jgi:hypothetical protein